MKKLLIKKPQINSFLSIVPATALVIILAITLFTACGDNDTPGGRNSENKPDSDSKKR